MHVAPAVFGKPVSLVFSIPFVSQNLFTSSSARIPRAAKGKELIDKSHSGQIIQRSLILCFLSSSVFIPIYCKKPLQFLKLIGSSGLSCDWVLWGSLFLIVSGKPWQDTVPSLLYQTQMLWCKWGDLSWLMNHKDSVDFSRVCFIKGRKLWGNLGIPGESMINCRIKCISDYQCLVISTSVHKQPTLCGHTDPNVA